MLHGHPRLFNLSISVIVEGRRPHCWSYGVTKHLSKTCPSKNPVPPPQPTTSKEAVGPEMSCQAPMASVSGRRQTEGCKPLLSSRMSHKRKSSKIINSSNSGSNANLTDRCSSNKNNSHSSNKNSNSRNKSINNICSRCNSERSINWCCLTPIWRWRKWLHYGAPL